MKIRKPRPLWRFIAGIKLGLRWKVFLQLFFFLIAPFMAAGIYVLYTQYESVRERLLWQYLAKMQNVALELELKIKDKAGLEKNNPLLLRQGLAGRVTDIKMAPLARKAMLRWFEFPDAKPFLYLFQEERRDGKNVAGDDDSDSTSSRGRLLYVVRGPAGYRYYVFNAKFLTDHLLASERLDPSDLMLMYNRDGSPACSNMIEKDFLVPKAWANLLRPEDAGRILPGSLRVLDLDGRSYVVMAGQLPGLPLIGVMAKPYEAAMGGLRTALFFNLGALAILLSISLLLSHVLARGQIGTLNIIRSFLERIAVHDYGFYPRIPGRDERRPIMRFLNTLRGRLRRYHQLNIERILLQEAKLNTIVENSRDPLLLLDQDLKVLLKNRRFKSTFETGRGFFVHNDAATLLRENDIRPVSGNTPFTADFPAELHVNSGARRTFAVHISEWIVDDRDLNHGYLISFHDITDMKRYEEELIDAREQAVQASRAKTDFLSHMSHEIRTPLNAILGVSDLLRDTGLNTAQKEYVDMFQRAGGNLLELINDILDFQKVEAGKIQLETRVFAPAELVGDTGTLLSHYSGAKKLKLITSLDPELPPLVSGDPRHLRQVLTNLIGNAVKFTSEGEIEVSARVIRKGDEAADAPARILFSVRDTGMGIPHDKQASVFESFSQVRDGAATVKGTGLGLTITRKLIELMGGEIKLRSEPGRGSEFYFELPFHVVSPEQGADGTQKAPEFVHDSERTYKILLAEDNTENRLLFQAYLRGEPALHVDFAEDGEQAVNRFRAGKYDLVLMDMQMPVKDGYQAVREIREMEQNGVTGEPAAAVPVLALTAFSLKEEIERCYQAGCTGHILKPVRRKEFLDAVKSNLVERASDPQATSE